MTDDVSVVVAFVAAVRGDTAGKPRSTDTLLNSEDSELTMFVLDGSGNARSQWPTLTEETGPSLNRAFPASGDGEGVISLRPKVGPVIGLDAERPYNTVFSSWSAFPEADSGGDALAAAMTKTVDELAQRLSRNSIRANSC